MLSDLQTGHSAKRNQETGLRGYPITRHRRFLDPYTSGVADLATTNARLARATQGNPRLYRLIDRVITAEQAWMTGSARPLFREPPPIHDLSRLQADLTRSKELFDACRRVEAAFQADIGHDKSVAQTRIRHALLTSLVVNFVIGLTVLLAAVRSNRRFERMLLPPVQHLRDGLRDLAAG